MMEAQTQPAYEIDDENVLRELPIECRLQEITETVEANKITIVSAKTGTGKSTRVPRALFDCIHGDGKVYVTQPRIIAARNVAARVGYQMNEEWMDGDTLVGYQTAFEGDATDESRIVIMTDGLLVRMVLDGSIGKGDTIVIDEFHERNTHQDTLLALCIEKDIKLVVMSATLDIERLQTHCENEVGISNVGLIEVEGVSFDVEDHTSPEDRKTFMSDTIAQAVKRGENVLAFVPGRSHAKLLEYKLRRLLGDECEILQLNGEQTIEEQQRVLGSYPNGKVIISTAVGQTSITIPDIYTVVDCGWERAGSYKNSIHGVPVQPCSLATLDQRRGRVGRTHEGKYFQARLDGGPEFPEGVGDVLSYDVPEILRTDISELVLTLASAGMQLCDMHGLLDKPADREVRKAESRLMKLGALAVDTCMITDDGREMLKYPFEPSYARMIVEAGKMSDELKLQMIAAASAMQVSGITSTEAGTDGWRKLVGSEINSDIVAQLVVFFESLKATPVERRRWGVIEQRFLKAKKYYETIAERSGLDATALTCPSSAQTEQLVDAILVGSENIFVRTGDKYKSALGPARRPSRGTVVSHYSTSIIAGRPFDIGVLGKNGVSNKRVITDMTGATVESLVRVMPHRVEKTVVGHRVVDGIVEEVLEVSVDGQLMPQVHHAPAKMSSASIAEGIRYATERFVSTESLEHHDEMTVMHISELVNKLEGLVALQHQTANDLHVDKKMQEAIDDVLSRYDLDEIDASLEKIMKLIPEILEIAQAISSEKRHQIRMRAPKVLTLHGQKFAAHYIKNVAHVDLPVNVILTMGPNEISDLRRQVFGRELLVRPSDLTTGGTRYVSPDVAFTQLSQPSRADRRGNALSSLKGRPARGIGRQTLASLVFGQGGPSGRGLVYAQRARSLTTAR